MSAEESCAAVIRKERQLLDPEVRRQPELVRALIHPEFVEFGASGRIWDAQSIVAALASEQTPSEIRATNLVAVLLDPGVVLLTFRTDSAGRACLRSSIWIRSDEDKWLLRFHQGTVIPE